MADSQIAQIKALEGTARQLIKQAADMRDEAKKTDDPSVRETLLKAADACEQGARNLAVGLRGMSETLQ